MNELRIRRLILDALHDSSIKSDRATRLDYETLIDDINNGVVVLSVLVTRNEPA